MITVKQKLFSFSRAFNIGHHGSEPKVFQYYLSELRAHFSMRDAFVRSAQSKLRLALSKLKRDQAGVKLSPDINMPNSI